MGAGANGGALKIVGLGACAPCVFQRLRQVGKGLDGELAQLVPPAGLTSAQTDAVIPAGTPLPSRSRSLKAEFRPTAQVHGIKALVRTYA